MTAPDIVGRMSALPPLAITGATGAVGGRVATRLASLGVDQRLVVSDPARAPELAGAVPVVAPSYLDYPAMRATLEGAATLFLCSARESPDRLQHHLTAVQAAVDAGVERIVYLSFLGAAADSVFLLGRQHFLTEQFIRGTGVGFTFLRSSLYADFVPYFAGKDGVIRGPAGSGKVSWISRDDIADTVVAALLDDTHAGQAYANTGPEALTLAETAAVLSRVTGTEVRYYEETLEEAWESRRPTGAPDWEIEGWISSYLAIAAGELEPVADTVQNLTGHPPTGLEEFLTANPTLWR